MKFSSRVRLLLVALRSRMGVEAAGGHLENRGPAAHVVGSDQS
jgi:hypothetical protein